MGTIVTIGGYSYENDEEEKIDTPLEIDKTILKLSKKKLPNVLFVPTASSDKPTYIKSIRKIYEGKLGTHFDVLLLHASELNMKNIKEKIEWADVIYVGGGNTLMMMKKWRRLGVDELLKEAFKQGKVLCGVSAGSICWFEYGISDSLQFYDDTMEKYIRVSGLGILEGTNCPHFGSKLWDKGHRTSRMKEIMKRTKGVCYAIPDGAALIFQDGEVISIALEKAEKCYWKDKKWFQEIIR